MDAKQMLLVLRLFFLLRNLMKVALFLLCLMGATWLSAETISGTILDPSGAAITGARIEITGGDLAQPLALSSDGSGKFSSPELKPGTYSVRVSRDGFEPLVKSVNLQGAAQLQFTLAIAQQQATITVVGKNLAYANSDPLYRQLRDVGLGQTYRLDNFTLTWDVGTFQFQKGTLTIVNPVNGVVTGAIFVGEGHFDLKPVLHLDAKELDGALVSTGSERRLYRSCFSIHPRSWLKVSSRTRGETGMPPEAATAFGRWKRTMRQRRESHGLYRISVTGRNHGQRGRRRSGRFLQSRAPGHSLMPTFTARSTKISASSLRARVGALPQLDSPEEVALINYDPEGMDDGVWYLSHLKSEYSNHTANSREDRRLFATHRYKIETVIAKNQHLFSTATITFASNGAGRTSAEVWLVAKSARDPRHSMNRGRIFISFRRAAKKMVHSMPSSPRPRQSAKNIPSRSSTAGDKVLEEAGEGSFLCQRSNCPGIRTSMASVNTRFTT